VAVVQYTYTHKQYIEEHKKVQHKKYREQFNWPHLYRLCMKWNWYISRVPLFFNSFENRLVLSKCVHIQRSYTRSGRTRDQLLAGESDSNERPAGGMWAGKVVCGPRKFSDTRDLYSSLRMNGDYVRELANFACIVKFSKKKV